MYGDSLFITSFSSVMDTFSLISAFLPHCISHGFCTHILVSIQVHFSTLLLKMGFSNHLEFPCLICQSSPTLGLVRWSGSGTTCKSGVPPSSPCWASFVIGNDSSCVVLLKFSEVAYIKQMAFTASLSFLPLDQSKYCLLQKILLKAEPRFVYLPFLSLPGLHNKITQAAGLKQ